MPKPEMRDPISASGLVCDRVAAYIQIHVQNLPTRFISALSAAFGFERKRDREGHWLDDLSFGPANIPCRIQTFIVNRETVGFVVELSPLVAIHRNSRTSTNERSLAGQLNWIKAGDIQANNLWAVAPIAPALFQARRHCIMMVEHILQNRRPAMGETRINRPCLAACQFSLREIEIAYDFASANPNLTVNRFAPIVASLCPEVSDRRYPRARYRTVTTIQGRMVDGYIHPHERIKIYVKALPDRVRFELALSGDRLRSCAYPARVRTRSLALVSDQSFQRIFAHVSVHAASRFQSIMNARVRVIRTDMTVIQLYTKLLTRLDNDVEKTNSILDQLVTDERLLASIGRFTLRRLASAGIIDSTRRHGIYPISPEYLRAIRLIAETPGFFFRSRLRRRFV